MQPFLKDNHKYLCLIFQYSPALTFGPTIGCVSPIVRYALSRREQNITYCVNVQITFYLYENTNVEFGSLHALLSDVPEGSFP